MLHTHSRKRDIHSHIHVVIPARHYPKARLQWHKGTKNYLHNEALNEECRGNATDLAARQ
ncbi:transposase [Psychromonas ingrahamii]|uniref:transposase n=1 Tax=Psychromonas ingrahamii TaxID=357794 RepID=UPI0018DE06ED